MNTLEIDLDYLDPQLHAYLFHFIHNANRTSLRQPFVCGEASDVLRSLIALVGKEDARREIENHPDCKLHKEALDDIFTYS